MYIKKVLEYVYNYAEYIVSDGKHDLRCVCMSVPLPNGRIPEVGLKITEICPYCLNELILMKVSNKAKHKDAIIKHLLSPLSYTLRGRVADTNKSIVQVFGFEISLEQDFPNGFAKDYHNGDYVKFHVDRLDCAVENFC